MAYGVGAALRHERTRRELTLAQISTQTRISERFLTAIENDNFGQLPGLLFARNFVRQYALALQLDPEPLLAQMPRVDVTEVNMPAAPATEQRNSWDPRWNSMFASMAWLVLALGAAVMAWLHFNRPAPMRAVPVVAAEHVPQPAPVETPARPAAAAATTVVNRSADQHPVQVVLTAKEEAWVQVTADGKVAFTSTMQPNDSRTISADDTVKVVTGNAGGIVISLNGKQLDSLGPSGQVRVVRLTAAGPQFVQKTPTPPPSDPL